MRQRQSIRVPAAQPRRSAPLPHGPGQVVLLTDDVRVADAVSMACAAAAVGLQVLGARAPLSAIHRPERLIDRPEGLIEGAEALSESEDPRLGMVLWGADVPASTALSLRGSRAVGEALVVTLAEGAEQAYALAQHGGGLPVVHLPEATGWLASRLAARQAHTETGRVVGFLSAAGGAGCTALATLCALAVASRIPDQVLLAAGEPWACGLADALSLDREVKGTQASAGEGITWGDLTQVKGVLNPAELHRALPSADGLRYLLQDPDAGELPSAAARGAVLEAARRAFPLTIADIGQGYRCADSLLEECDELLLLIPATVRSVTAARSLHRVISEGSGQQVRGVVVGREHRGTPPPEHIAQWAGVPYGAFVRWDPKLRAADAAGALPTYAHSRTIAPVVRMVMGS